MFEMLGFLFTVGPEGVTVAVGVFVGVNVFVGVFVGVSVGKPRTVTVPPVHGICGAAVGGETLHSPSGSRLSSVNDAGPKTIVVDPGVAAAV
jgi:hypothetical protein